MHKAFDNILDVIGNTPIVQLKRSMPKGPHQFFAKIEFMNPGASIKDRIALAMVEDAEKSGRIKPGGTIVEATSGNTGVGLAMVAAVKGYKCIFVMPEKISEEKRATLRAYGAQVVITPTGVAPEDPRSHYSVAAKFVEKIPNSFYVNQYDNPANAKKHYETTGPEIWQQMDGKIDALIGGAGTGGTLSGCGRYLREKNPEMRVVCADPIGSILYDLFYHKKVIDPAGSYLVEGIGEDMLPKNVHFDVMTDFIRTNDKEAFELCRKISAEEGILVGPSTGSIIAAAIKHAETLKKPSRILMIFPDSGKSYLSKAFNEAWLQEKGLAKGVMGGSKVSDVLKTLKTNSAGLQCGDSLLKATTAFQEMNAQALRVFDSGKLLGVLFAQDVLEALALGRVKGTDLALHLVRSALPEVSQNDDLDLVGAKILKQNAVRVRETGDVLTSSELAAFGFSR